MKSDAAGLPDEVVRAARPVKHSFSIAGHRTSISLEAAFWAALRAAAAAQSRSVASLIAEVDRRRGDAGLSSAVRVWLLELAIQGGLPGAARSARPDVQQSTQGERS